jgi:hypothetical protein
MHPERFGKRLPVLPSLIERNRIPELALELISRLEDKFAVGKELF